MANKRNDGYKDLMVQFYSEGMEAVRNTVQSQGTSRAILDRLVQELSQRGADTGEVEALILEVYGEKGTGKGRTPPQNGQTRTYKAQQVKDQGVFVRGPLETLGVNKGELVNITFCASAEDLPDLAEGPFLVVRAGAAPQAQEVEEDQGPEGEDIDTNF